MDTTVQRQPKREQRLAQLRATLRSLAAQERALGAVGDGTAYTYNRICKVSCDLVWKAWSTPALLAQWYGPGVHTMIHAFDLRPGGLWLSEMRWNGRSDFSRMTFEEVEAGARLTWLHQTSDAEWRALPSAVMPDWPQKLRSTLTLAEHGRGTMLQLVQEPVDASAAERACFAQMRAGLDSGWSKGFDHMEQLLTRRT
ncbi:SRPBCC domain-containing protein [Shimia sp. R10_1]|uniref:SRPBCC family protein n=1 Tax=Shimia sp. R10_1 TaxID=2821095 RepID=UPI001AD9628F|nr:SRPBCC domain-containing protein [Shimia sp. R10_1]MBO9474610.1 SRPBCC domain-containing protein [Shimia sp. R10_1]